MKNPFAKKPAKSITIIRPDDWHVHLRDGKVLNSVAQYTTRQFGRAIIMPNLPTSITTIAAAQEYRMRISETVDPQHNFTALMTCYLTDSIDADELAQGHAQGVFTAAKLYPAHATTNSAHGVTDINNIRIALETMQRIGMPLLVHGEVTDADIDIFDREAAFIDTVMFGIIRDFPELKIVIEHITTSDAATYVHESGPNIAATITPHHLLINRSDMLVGGIKPHLYCLPIAKRETHRLALRAAAISGSPKFFLGTDSAPHLIDAKQSACGCAGVFNAPYAIESYATVFDQEGALDKLEAFASKNGPRFYGLPENKTKIKLVRKDIDVPETLPCADATIVPFHAGETLPWRFVG